MAESGIANLVFNKLCGIIAAIPEPNVSPAFKLIKAVYNAFSSSSSVTLDTSIA